MSGWGVGLAVATLSTATIGASIELQRGNITNPTAIRSDVAAVIGALGTHDPTQDTAIAPTTDRSPSAEASAIFIDAAQAVTAVHALRNSGTPFLCATTETGASFVIGNEKNGTKLCVNLGDLTLTSSGVNASWALVDPVTNKIDVTVNVTDTLRTLDGTLCAPAKVPSAKALDNALHTADPTASKKDTFPISLSGDYPTPCDFRNTPKVVTNKMDK